MKKLYFFFAMAVSVGFVSCFEAEEKTVINKDDSGTYNMSMDISGMMQQMQALAGSAMGGGDGLDKKDTVIQFKDYTDTSSALSLEEKAMLRDGSLTLHMDQAIDDMKFTISLPFKNINQLPKLKQELAVAMDKLKLTEKLMKEEDAGKLGGMMQQSPGASMAANPLEGAFSLSIGKNMISNKLTDSSFVDRLLSGNTNLQAMKQMAPMFGDLKYKTTYVLPVEIKNYKGANAELSNDRKTISFTSGLTDMFDKPAVLEYEVTF